MFLEAKKCCTAKAVYVATWLWWSTLLFLSHLFGHLHLISTLSPPQDFGVELHIWLVVWPGRMNSLKIIPSISKNQINIDFTLLSLALLSLDGCCCFRFIPINPTFITSYDLGKEVCVDPDLLLKFFAELQPMLLLIVSQSQQLGHEFCRNLPHVEFICQNALAWLFHTVVNIVDQLPVALADYLRLLQHFPALCQLKIVQNVCHFQLTFCHF
jgi:hypothetical protein